MNIKAVTIGDVIETNLLIVREIFDGVYGYYLYEAIG
jgi:hypothetical protein